MNLGLRRFEVVVILALFAVILVVSLAIWFSSRQSMSEGMLLLLPRPSVLNSAQAERQGTLESLDATKAHQQESFSQDDRGALTGLSVEHQKEAPTSRAAPSTYRTATTPSTSTPRVSKEQQAILDSLTAH